MAKPPGFAHHAKAAKAAHDSGDHTTANHHIGKMFALNRKASSGFQGAEPDEEMVETADEAVRPAPKDPRAMFAKLRGTPGR